MKTKIVVDSSSNLYTLSGVDFVCVPLKIVTDDGEYLDTAELDAAGMAQTLRSYKGKTGTSCPNVADWLAAYEGAEEVFVVTITGTLSGSYNAAQLAAEEYRQEHEGARVFVLDSLSAGPECRLLAERLAALVQAGCAFDDAAERILAYHRHTHLLFSLESLANLARNGRVKPAVAAVARMLGIRVIGQASEAGELEVLCKTRGEHGALERIVLEMKGRGFVSGRVHIAHCGNPDAADRLKKMLHAVFPGAQVDVSPCGGLCSYRASSALRAARILVSLVCHRSNSEKPGRPIGTPSRRKVMRLSSTCLPERWNARAPVWAASAGRLPAETPAPTRISTSLPAASTSWRSSSAPCGALAACPLVRMVARPSSFAAVSAAKGSRQTSKARCRVQATGRPAAAAARRAAA